ncbi:MAG: hypothetical protein ABI439_08315 [Rhodospirillales bacterium]
MTRFVLAIAAIAAGMAIAWQSGWIKPDAFASQVIARQRVAGDFDNYRRLYFEAAVLRSGERMAEGHDAYVKAFARDGRLALCGFAVVPTGPITQRTRAWLDNGRLEIAGQRIRSNFIAVQAQTATPSDAEAGCASTELAWRDGYRSAPLKLTGVPLLDAP